MRIWSINPVYLDSKGLVALWRETLLAKKVLEGQTKGYLNHPQLNRFKVLRNPVDYIDKYLEFVYAEALERGYNFDVSKFNGNIKVESIIVTSGQLDYEFKHLQNKLKERDPKRFLQHLNETNIRSHPLFKVVNGGVESWEIIRK